MGAWGSGPLENDDGAEIQAIWQRYVAVSSWSSDEVCAFFKDVFFRGSLPVASDGSSGHIIAIAHLLRDLGELPQVLEQPLANALAHELEPSALDAWGGAKKKRKAALLGLADRCGLKIASEAGPALPSRYANEIASLRNWFDNLERICSVRESMSGELMAFIESIKPAFGKRVAAETYELYDPNDEDGAAELGTLRYMYLIWLVLFDLKHDTQAIKRALEAVRP